MSPCLIIRDVFNSFLLNIILIKDIFNVITDIFI